MLNMAQFAIIGFPTVLSLIIVAAKDDPRFQVFNMLAGIMFLVSMMAMATQGGGPVTMFLILVAGGMAFFHFWTAIKRYHQRVANRLNKPGRVG
jgi:hypothetical protein